MRYSCMMDMTKKFLVTGVVLLLVATLVFISPLNVKPAEAHITKVVGNYLFEVGWNDEPAYTGLVNQVQVTVKKGSGDNATPVINALKDLQISIQYGSVTKPLDFLPSSTVNGQYVSSLIPTRVGTYNLVFKGSIQNQNIDTEMSLDDVASVNALNFPSSGGSSSGGILDSNQMGMLVNQLTSDIEDAKNNADLAAKSVSNVVESFKQVKDTTDRLYLISMTGIGIGAAGIVIAVVALSRKK